MRSLAFLICLLTICSCCLKKSATADNVIDLNKLESRTEQRGTDVLVVRFYRAADGREVRHGPTSVFHPPNRKGDTEWYEHGQLLRISKRNSGVNL